jgi:hypothetical protein
MSGSSSSSSSYSMGYSSGQKHHHGCISAPETHTETNKELLSCSYLKSIKYNVIQSKTYLTIHNVSMCFVADRRCVINELLQRAG